ncbi:hypothetical protein ACQPZF_01985 [Actinosynnema sp. CS-041913]|uniref:hypothetical protein n=1 Tax=Actinosynnema sp. CS-041913 TaxID=3239917 RepID=UPI003D912CDC
MTEPTGPLPPSVYRRRRALAIGGSVVALVLAVWLVGALTGRGDPAPVVPVAAGASSPPPQADRPFVASSSSTASPAPTSPVPSPSAEPSPSPTPPSSTPPTPTTPPGPPPPCEDDRLSVRAEVESPSYPAGRPVGLKILVGSTGQLPCAKEIGRAVRELVVTTPDGGTRLWSSNDCFDTDGSEVRVMQPGELFEYRLTWLGSTSEPGCAKHTRLGPGDYLLFARVAGKTSDPVVFRMT